MAKQKTVQQIYQKKTPLEHILLRPDTYIGTVQPIKQQKWVLPKNELRFQYKQVTYTPGFYKIFDEVLVNASDNYQRDKKMNMLKVQINQEQGYIKVRNNGKGIPVVIHKQHKIWVPELIFGHLLTGSNYNDDQRRVVGGRNGYGAKLANVFSNKFIVQAADGQNKKKFKMVWKKNMSIHDQAQIQSYSGKDFVEVTFYPCFQKFNMQNGLDDDTVSLLYKRVYDMAGIMPRVKVSLNEKEIQIKSFSEYVDYYFDKDTSPTKIFDRQVNSQRWEVIVSISQGEFRQVSFVNSVCTSKGGTHVNYIVDQIVDKIQDKIKKKQKNLNVKSFQIKAHIWIFINCLIENPTFDTQTKQTMTLKTAQFGSKCQLSEKMIKQFLKLGIVDTVINLAKAKQLTKLAKTTAGTKKTKLTGIPKLQDANEAGGSKSKDCTLILTEGDSAKSLAMAGLSVIGRDFYGVFPLRGKLLNVRQANNKTLMQNEQIQSLLKIIGLSIGKQYDNLSQLRYGAIMIMSDQDTDGSHIKGLVVNFVHFFWPSLFKVNGFVKQFITPLLKVTKGNQVVSFYTMNDFKRWSQGIQNIKTWIIKYYKGLGTSSDKQARQYFQDLRKHKIDFQYIDQEDDNSLELIFSKKKVEERKTWLSTYDPREVMVYDRPRIRYKQFVDREFIHFSNQDNCRSIGSLIDGFKPGQRKILFGCFKRNLTTEIKVVQLAGYISQNTAYHHGEMSLVETIVGMAQNYVGSNNINLLMPNGQFGSRNMGGKDHASARYIFTRLNRITRYIYPQPDDHSLTYVEDDGQIVQPEFYVPIIPMILVNGCQGIGTGWSTFIPNFNPREIVDIIKNKLQKGQDFREIHPWYRNYTGQIQPNNDRTSYSISGSMFINQSKQNTVIINQLPLYKWTKDYKLGVDDIMKQGEEKIVGLRQYHTKERVYFQIEMNQNFMGQLYNGDDNLEKLQKYLKLSSSISMKNMVGFNQQRKLVRMPNVKDIIQKFYDIRLRFYDKRKEYLKSKLVRDLVLLKEKERFILQVVQEKLVIRNVKKVELCKILKVRKYIKFSQFPKVKSTKHVPKLKKRKAQGQDTQGSQNSDNQNQVNVVHTPQKQAKQYNYLLEMPLWNLTYEKVQDIKAKRKQKQDQLKVLQKTTIQDMWIKDLDDFLKMLDKFEQDDHKQRMKEQQAMKKNIAKGGGQQKAVKKKAKGQKKPAKKKGQYDWDSDDKTQSDFGDIKKGKSKQKIIQKKIDNVAKKQTKKQTKNEPKKQKQQDDFLTRIKKKAESAPNQYLSTKQPSHQTTLQAMFSKKSAEKQSKQSKNIQFEMVPNPNKNFSKKQTKGKVSQKKMTIDSDEQEKQQYSEYSDNDGGSGSEFEAD